LHRASKTKLFSDLVTSLQEDPLFNVKVLSKLNQYKKSKLSSDLYAGDCYSTSYLAVRKFVMENKPELISKLEEIETLDVNLLEATNAYSIISHFDEMLIDKLGNQISIEDGTKGLEIEGKYSYH
jgi:hypothetical protein